MDVAAQQVQREVQSVARQRDDEKHHHVAGNGAQGVEYLCNHAARQHQGHQTGIGQNVSEVARDVVIERAEYGPHLAKPLGVPAGANQHHHAADKQHKLGHAQSGQPPAEKHDPPSSAPA